MTISASLWVLGTLFWVRSTEPETARWLWYACTLLGFVALGLEALES